jgi:lipopolysaccharide transport system permease protein
MRAGTMARIVDEIADFWAHRDLTFELAKREIRVRFLGSIMGKYWNFIHPITFILVYTFIFSKILGVRAHASQTNSSVDYAIFLCAGLLPWNFFSEQLIRGTNCLGEYSHLIKKIKFPLLVIPFSIAISSSFSFLISVFVYLVFMGLKGYPMTGNIFLFPVVYLLQALFALGLTQISTVLNVFFRDVQQVLGVALQLLFWGTPIVYGIEQVPDKYIGVLEINPMSHCIALYRSIFLGTPFSWASLLTFASFAFVSAGIGLLVMIYAKNEVLDQM